MFVLIAGSELGRPIISKVLNTTCSTQMLSYSLSLSFIVIIQIPCETFLSVLFAQMSVC